MAKTLFQAARAFAPRATLLLAAVLTLPGCTTVGVSQLNSAERVENYDCKVPTYVEAKAVQVPYEVVCEVRVRQFLGEWTPFESAAAFDEAYPYACSCRPDAVIVADAEGLVLQSGLSVLAVRYTSAAAAPPPAIGREELRTVLTCRDQGGSYLQGKCVPPADGEFHQTPNNRRLRGL